MRGQTLDPQISIQLSRFIYLQPVPSITILQTSHLFASWPLLTVKTFVSFPPVDQMDAEATNHLRILTFTEKSAEVVPNGSSAQSMGLIACSHKFATKHVNAF